MTYEEIKTIFGKYSFITEEITRVNRVIYVRAPETNFDMTEDWRNIIATARFDYKKPILEEIQFYTDFYLTKGGICTSDRVRLEWIDEKITEAKLERKCKNLVKRIKSLTEKHKLNKITGDF
jgi:hypothetical protein